MQLDGPPSGSGGTRGGGGHFGGEGGDNEQPPPAIIECSTRQENTTEENVTETTREREKPKRRMDDDLKMQNDANVKNMFKVIDSSGWQPVVTTGDEYPVRVWKKKILPGTYVANGAVDEEAATKFACIKATAVILAPPQEVYKLFLDNSRVSEYNEHCAKLEDVEYLSKDTKIAWSATNPYDSFGITKARDFLTMVHYRRLPDGTRIVVNRPVVHPARPAGGTYQRAELMLAGNVIRPVKGHPDKTELTLITHINPGGIADNAVGAAIINKLTASSPVEFIKKLEAAARKTMKPSGAALVERSPAEQASALMHRLQHRLDNLQQKLESWQPRIALR